MLVQPTTNLYACITDDGSYVPETVLTEPEFADTVHRHAAESLALACGDGGRVRWKDVTDNEDFWLDDRDNLVLTEQGRTYLRALNQPF
jgi:hypothetical protein